MFSLLLACTLGAGAATCPRTADERPKSLPRLIHAGINNIECEFEAGLVIACGHIASWLIGVNADEAAHWLLKRGLDVLERSQYSKYQLFKGALALDSPLITLGDEDRLVRLRVWRLARHEKYHAPSEEVYCAEARDLAYALRNVGDHHAALALFRELYQIRMSAGGSQDDPTDAHSDRCISLLFNIYYELESIGDHSLARTYFDRFEAEVDAAQERRPHAGHLIFARTSATMLRAMDQWRAGATDPAIKAMRKVVALRKRKARLHTTGWRKIQMPNNVRIAELVLADMLEADGKGHEAEAIKRAALEKFRAMYPMGHNWVRETVESLAPTLFRRGAAEEAVQLMERSLAAETQRHDMGHRDRVVALSFLTAADLAREIESEGTITLAARGVRALRLVDEMREQVTSSPPTTARQARTIAAGESDRLDMLLRVSAGLKRSNGSVFTMVEARRHRSTLGFGATWHVRSSEVMHDREQLRQMLHGPSNALHDPNNQEAAIANDAGMQGLLDAVIQIDRRRELQTAEIAAGSARPIDFSPSAVAEQLGPNDAVVTYLQYREKNWDPASRRFESGRDRLLAFVLTSDGQVERLDIGYADRVRHLVTDWRRSIGKAPLLLAEDANGGAENPPGGKSTTERIGEELREIVLGKVLQIIGTDVETLYVCSDDALHSIPLDALPLDGAFVGNEIQVQPLVSLGQLLDSRTRRSGHTELLAVGDVSFDADVGSPVVQQTDGGLTRSAIEDLGPWGALPRSREEVLALHTIATGQLNWRNQLIMKEWATKSAFIEAAAGKTYIHLSTHGFEARERLGVTRQRVDLTTSRGQLIDFAPGLVCGLCFAGANCGENRAAALLTAEEVRWLDLSSCHLLTLAACDTQIGWSRAGLGCHSFQVSGHAAGARFVISTLWKIDDRATAALMKEFYRLHIVEGEPVAEALWKAKMELYEDQWNLDSWSGFVVSGTPE